MFVANSLCSSKKKKMTTACPSSTWLTGVVRSGAGGSISKLAYLCGLQIGTGCLWSCQMVLRARDISSFSHGPLHSLYRKWLVSKSNRLKRTRRKWMTILWLTLGNYITLFWPYFIGGGSHKVLLRFKEKGHNLYTTQSEWFQHLIVRSTYGIGYFVTAILETNNYMVI